MIKHLGSTIAIIFGVTNFATCSYQQSINNPRFGSYGIMGFMIIVGALAYRSAKKRNLGTIDNSLTRKTYEAVSIAVIVIAILLQNDLKAKLVNEPVMTLLIPLWIIIAYAIAVLRKPKVIQENGKNKHDWHLSIPFLCSRRCRFLLVRHERTLNIKCA